MSLFIDTSALYALMVRTETHHEAVLAAFRNSVETSRTLWATSYVVVETIALLQYRIGLPPVRDFDQSILPLLSVEWVSSALHRRGMARLARENRRHLSLVDCTSFEFMANRGIGEALSLDRHFRQAGFEVLPHLD